MLQLFSYYAKRRLLTNLQHEATKVEGIVVQYDPARIARDGIQSTQDHAAHEEPFLPQEAEVDVDAGCQGIEDDEGDARGQAGPVPVKAGLDRAYLERAVAIGAEEDNIGGQAAVICHVDAVL